MKSEIRAVLVGAVASALLASGPVVADNHEESEDYLLEITEIDLKIGHWQGFSEGMKAYMECYAENDGAHSWSAWQQIGGEGTTYHLVSSMPNWAAMDERDEASMGCWSVIEEKVAPHVSGVSTRFARSLPDWSGDAEGYNVVRLHQFRVDDGDLFRETVGTITSILKEAEYEHMGTWYDVIGNSSNQPGYFVVSHFENFAAMDEDRAGAYGTIVEAEGEARADELWAQFGEALRDDWDYFTVLLRRSEELSYDAEE